MKRWVLECVLVLAILFVLGRVFSSPSGSIHFSPDTLESKYRAEQRILGLIPTYISMQRVKSSPLVAYLVTNGHWVPTDTSNPRWIVTGHFSDDWKDGQSELHRVLYWQDEQWIAWTEANPELARFVWPRFLDAVRQSESDGEPFALLFLAKRAGSVEELQQLVQKSDLVDDNLKKLIANAGE
jgi:hypothetical protein